MTTAAPDVRVADVDRANGGPFARGARDAFAIAQRNLIAYRRVPQLLVFSTIQPVVFVLMFRYVFGGAVGDFKGFPYVDFLMPGVFVQTVVFGSLATAIGLATDLKSGLLERFRSLPMARSAVLFGRTLADLLRNVFVLVLMLLVGFLVGFRVHADVVAFIVSMLLVLLFGYAFSWIFAIFGLVASSPESAQAMGFIIIFPLTFLSSAFVPVESMPAALQWFAEVNPVTAVVDATRALWLDAPAGDSIWRAVAWLLALIAVFAPLSVARYRRAVTA